MFFNPPYKYNPSNAEKYLKVKSITNLKEFNKRTVTSLCTETNTSDDKKVFTFADIGGLDEAIATLKKVCCPSDKLSESFRKYKAE